MPSASRMVDANVVGMGGLPCLSGAKTPQSGAGRRTAAHPFIHRANDLRHLDVGALLAVEQEHIARGQLVQGLEALKLRHDDL